ncbi:MAG: tetratricopeptide repeat protein, partial [Proteobacteria bacterium]
MLFNKRLSLAMRISFSKSFFLVWMPIAFCPMAIFSQSADDLKAWRNVAEQRGNENRDKVEKLIQLGRYAVGKTGEQKSDLDSATVYFNQAIRISNDLDYKQGIAKSMLLNAKILQESGRAKESYAIFKKTIAFANRHNLALQEAEAITEYAQRWKTTPDELPNKMAEYKKALNIYAGVGAKSGKNYAIALKDMADFHQMYGENKESIAYLQKSLAVSKAIHDRDVQGTYVLLANNYRHIGDFGKALPLILKAQEIAESNRDRTSQMAMIYNHIAITYHDLKKPDRALEYFYKALE